MNREVSMPLKLLLLCLVGFALYSFMLEAPFKTPDDTYSTTSNPLVTDLSNAGTVFRSSFFGTGHYYRPLVQLSFMLEYQLFRFDPFFYNLDNLLLHLFNALIVFSILKIILNSAPVALGAAMLFVVHPIHWEAVANITGRAILLCAFFELLSLLFFLKAVKLKKGIIYYFLSLMMFALALLSKESAAILPLVMMLYFFIERKRQDVTVAAFLQRLIPYFVLIGGYIAIRNSLGFTEILPWRSVEEYILGFTTFLRGNLTYWRLFVWPVDLYFDRAQALLPSVTHPEFVITLIIYSGLALMLWRFRKRIPAIGWFFIGWYALGLLPVSQLVTTIGVQPGYISIAEHFLYIPSIGIFALASLAYTAILNNEGIKFSRQHLKVVVCIYCFFLCIMTITQNIYAQDTIAMYRRSIEMNPRNIRILDDLALRVARLGKYEEAERYCQMILAVDPAHVRARIALGKSLCDQGRCEEALVEYNKVTEPGKYSELLQGNIQKTKEIIGKP